MLDGMTPWRGILVGRSTTSTRASCYAVLRAVASCDQARRFGPDRHANRLVCEIFLELIHFMLNFLK
jgi:hypothetical protein